MILLLSLSQLNGQNIEIRGVQKYCKDDYKDSRERYIKLIYGKEIIQDSIDNGNGFFVIKNLSRGKYIIEFTNIFGQKINKEIIVNNRKTEVEICVDSFKDTDEETFFQKLSTKNKLQFNFSSAGCFHWQNEKIVFSLEVNNEIYCEYTNEEGPPIRKKLKEKQLQYLISFERKLRQMKNNMGGCTTSDSYHLILDKEELNIVDDSCDWNGFYRLKEEIFDLKK